MLYHSYMKHSIRFGDGTLDERGRFKGVDTYEDWHLIPSSRPTIAMPGVETKFVTIPGRDGTVDLSQYIRKDRPAFGNRGGTFEFYVENDQEFWMTIYPKIVNTLHGKKIKMVLNEDDPDYFWEGRFTVDKYEPGDGSFSTVSISYQVGPYKWRIRAGGDMVWDNFNFEKDYDNSILPNTIYGTGNVVRVDVKDAAVNTNVSIGNEKINMNGKSAGCFIRVINGPTEISMTGAGTFEWREGSL